jgi:hypothetical protein
VARLQFVRSRKQCAERRGVRWQCLEPARWRLSCESHVWCLRHALRQLQRANGWPRGVARWCPLERAEWVRLQDQRRYGWQ